MICYRNTLFILLTLLGQVTLAQQGENLIFNGGFEERNLDSSGFPLCPLGAGYLPATVGWHPLLSPGDYLHTCSNTITTGVPQNRGGYQYPKDGEGYVVIGGYRPWGENMREFLWIEIPDSLKAGYGYEFEGWVSLCDSMNFAMAGFGALFTEHDMWDYSDIDWLMNSHPQVLNPYDSLLDDKENWMKVSGYFVAQGGEKFMTVGFFRRDEDDNIQRVSNHPEATYNWEGAGYYVDGLALYEVSGLGEGEQLSMGNEQLAIHPNPASEKVQMTVQGSKFKVAEVVVIDHLGRSVLNLRPESKNNVTQSGVQGFELDLSSWPSGIYTVSVHLSDGTILHERLVVQHR